MTSCSCSSPSSSKANIIVKKGTKGKNSHGEDPIEDKSLTADEPAEQEQKSEPPSTDDSEKRLNETKNFTVDTYKFWKINDESNGDQLKTVTGICLMFGALIVMGLYSNLL